MLVVAVSFSKIQDAPWVFHYEERMRPFSVFTTAGGGFSRAHRCPNLGRHSRATHGF